MTIPARAVAVSLLVLSACDSQYVAIPGAKAVPEKITWTLATPQRPTVTVTEGAPALTRGGGPVTLKVDFSTVTELKPTAVLFMAKGVYGNWELALTAAEQAAGFAMVEVHALKDSPTSQWCKPDQRGDGNCSQLADEGVSFFGLTMGANGSSSGYIEAPITLPPLAPTGNGPTTTCPAFTLKDCCAGSPGISAVACYVAEECGCPGETSITGGVRSDGTVMCTCP